MTIEYSEIYQWYLVDYRDSLRTTSDTCMILSNIEVYQWYMDDGRDSLMSTRGTWMIIDIV